MNRYLLAVMVVLISSVGFPRAAPADCCRYEGDSIVSCMDVEVTCECNCGFGPFGIIITFTGGNLIPYELNCDDPCYGLTVPEGKWVATEECTGSYTATWSASCPNPPCIDSGCPYTTAPWPVRTETEQCDCE